MPVGGRTRQKEESDCEALECMWPGRCVLHWPGHSHFDESLDVATREGCALE